MTAVGPNHNVEVLHVRHKKELPVLSSKELDRVLLAAKEKAVLFIHIDSDEGVSFLTLASFIFKRLAELKRPCLNVVVSREVAKSESQATRLNPYSGDSAEGGLANHGNFFSIAAEGARNEIPSVPSLDRYDVVAVGGTFDRMHAGHRLLLTAAAWTARETLIIGVAGDDLLTGKQHKDLIALFDERSRAVESYVKDVEPAIACIKVVKLIDAAGPTATDPSIDALVVSGETSRGANDINRTRLARGLRPLRLIVVDVLHTDSQKLSSSELRSAEHKRRYDGHTPCGQSPNSTGQA